LQHAEVLTQTIKGKRVMIVTNTVVAPLYLERIVQLLSGYQVEHLILPDGEAYKTWLPLSGSCLLCWKPTMVVIPL
jgi:3-dehydroquinate synthase